MFDLIVVLSPRLISLSLKYLLEFVLLVDYLLTVEKIGL
jgi:hypothetical protein